MIEVATALLRTEDDKIVFQRRSSVHRLNPGKLGLFGGHLEPEDNLDPETALERELAEETSLKLGELTIIKSTSFFMPESVTGDDLWYHMHEILLPKDQLEFDVLDGEGVEIIEKMLLPWNATEPAARFALGRTEDCGWRLV